MNPTAPLHPPNPPGWIDRKFSFSTDPGQYHSLIDRFRGAPVRMAGLLYGVDRALLTARLDGKWSMLEHAGHLLDLEDLAVVRLEEYRKGARELSPADMGNRKTFEAGHNGRDPEEIVERFQDVRSALAGALAAVPRELIERRSRHPRLKMDLRLIDWVEFMAEHDDHHLAAIARLRESLLREV